MAPTAIRCPSPGVDAVPTHRPERALPRASVCREAEEAAQRGAPRRALLVGRRSRRRRRAVRDRSDGAVDRGATTPSSRPPRGAAFASIEIRGVHVTMGLASLSGKLKEYVDLEREGLTAIELDVKDENGQVGFLPRSSPLASEIGAAREYYTRAPWRASSTRGGSTSSAGSSSSRTRTCRTGDRSSRSAGATARCGRTPRASAGRTRSTGAVGKYNVDLAAAAARAGFDEILFDYVRFPSTATSTERVPEPAARAPSATRSLRSCGMRRGGLEPLGVRVGRRVRPLRARDLGIGQLRGAWHCTSTTSTR